ncbi:hypothetical protein CBS101457_001481 [Exobasidium rhododendri]|nr:hypothetical protein CBS101457_001481 [Exobasidium rhododendri]
MPARTIPSAAASTAVVPKPSKATASVRGAHRTPVATREGAASSLAKASSSSMKPVKAATGKYEAIVASIKSPRTCKRDTVDSFLSVLGLSASHLGLHVASPSFPSGSKSEVSFKATSASNRQTQPISENNTYQKAISSPSFSDPKRIYLAKQVVNAVIVTLNDLVSKGWNSKGESELHKTNASSRSNSRAGSSRSSTTASSKRTGKSVTNPSSHSSSESDEITESQITAIFECSRIAIYFLQLSDEIEGTQSTKDFELYSIRSSIIRKMLALNLHAHVSNEIESLRKALHVKLDEKVDEDTRFGFAIPSSTLPLKVRDLILEVQALALSCTLYSEPSDHLDYVLTNVVNHAQGPLSWQHYLRREASEESTMSANRHAYSIERIITKYLCSRPNCTDYKLILQCRKVSLYFLLFVTDLDVDAFWDRAARVGSSHYRSMASGEGCSDIAKRAAFESIDEVFRDIVRRAEQIRATREERKGGPSKASLRGKAFSTFCESWIHLAQRAGEAQAINYIAEQLSGLGKEDEGAEGLTVEQINDQLKSTGAKMAQAVISLDEILAGKANLNSKGDDLKLAEDLINCKLDLTPMSSDASLQKYFRVLDQLRRRGLRLLAEGKCRVDAVSPLLLAICRQYERYLESDGKGKTENDQAILEDFLLVLRSLANAIFVLSDISTHAASAGYLSKCDTMLQSRKGKMILISEQARCGKLRLLSSSWYYIGGQLYNDKKLSLAIPFIKAACECAQRSLELYEQVNRRGESIEAGLDWKRPEGVAKKWEHLAVSYRFTSQARLSYKAYLHGLSSVLQSEWDTIEERASRCAINDVFRQRPSDSASKSISDVATMAKSAFEIASFDLLIHERGEQDDVYDRLLGTGTPSGALGTLLECCLLALDNTMHKEEGPKAALTTIDNLLELYSSNERPLRRARVLIRKLELTAMQPQLGQDMESFVHLPNEAENLLNQKNHYLDKDLAHFIPQYRTSLHLLQLLLDQQISAPLVDSRLLHHAKEATHWLDEVAKQKVPSDVAAASPTTARSTLKMISASRQQSVATEPITPAKGKTVKSAAPKGTERMEEVSCLLDDAPRFYSLLELSTEMLSASGHSLAAVKLTRVATKLTSRRTDSVGRDYHVRFSATLTRHYLLLGDTLQADQVVAAINSKAELKGIPEDTICRYLFASAEYHCHAGRLEKSLEVYHAAVQIACKIEPEGRMNSLQSGIHRCLASERQALAAETIASIQFARGDTIRSLQSSVLGVKRALKAGLILAQLTSTHSGAKSGDPSEESTSPFIQMSKPEEGASSDGKDVRAPPSPPPPPRLSTFFAGVVYWRSVKVLITAYRRISRLYRLRGSARDAEAFIGEAVDFATSLNIPLTSSKILVERGSIRIQMNAWEKGLADLGHAVRLMGEESETMEGLELVVTRGEQEMMALSWEAAYDFFERGKTLLAVLVTQYTEVDTILPSQKVRKNGPKVAKAAAATSKESLLSEMKGRVLQKQAWLLQLLERFQESKEAMDQAAVLLSRGECRTENLIYQGKIAVQQSLSVLKADQVMGMLSDSAISMPMIRSSRTEAVNGRSNKILAKKSHNGPRKSAMDYLHLAQTLLKEGIDNKRRLCLDSIVLRDAYINLATSLTLSSMLSGVSTMGVQEITGLLDRANSLSLEREMLEVIDVKLESSSSRSESTVVSGWHQPVGKEEPRRGKQARSSSSELSSSEGEGGKEEEEERHSEFWTQARARHEGETWHIDLPSNWTVISITLAREQNRFVLTRRSGDGSEPVLFSLPIDRQNKREGEEEEDSMGMDAVLQELKTIIEDGNVSIRSAQHLTTMEERKEWWTRRREADNRVKELLQGVETTWLGAFKSIFLPPPKVNEEEFLHFRNAFDAIFQRAFFSRSCSGSSSSSSSKKTPQAKLHDTIIRCFTALSQISCTDEELEDLVHFVMDAYQFQGLPVAVDEIDLDLCVTDLRSLLEGHRARLPTPKEGAEAEEDDDVDDDDRHIFLLLDKDTCGIPWESIPILRRQAVCRIPSIAFLQDRIHLSHRNRNTSHLTTTTPVSGRFTIPSDRAKVWYLLNPGKDLTRTQDRFLPWLESKTSGRSSSSSDTSKWTGISGRAPLMDEMATALQSNDLVLYFGHGGGEQYIRPTKVRSLKSCAVAMLWGCSSGSLRDLGDFDRSGTPWNYLMAGCPSLLGNLWDATDKELDGISESVLEKMGLRENVNRERGGDGQQEEKRGRKSHVSIAKAIAQSRDACKFPYLTGAACVVYGIPVYYT